MDFVYVGVLVVVTFAAVVLHAVLVPIRFSPVCLPVWVGWPALAVGRPEKSGQRIWL